MYKMTNSTHNEIIKLSQRIGIIPHKCLLPIQYGLCSYTITVIRGSMCIKQTSILTNNGKYHRLNKFDYLKSEESLFLQLNIDELHYEFNKIVVMNRSLIKPLLFTYSVNFIY